MSDYKTREDIAREKEEFEEIKLAEEIRNTEHVEKLYNLIITNKYHEKNFGSKYKPEYIKDMLLHIGVEGKSYKSLAFKLGVSSSSLSNWEKAHPEWREARQCAEQGRLGSIEDTLIQLGTGKIKGNAAAAIFYAKNAAPDEFKDKREIGVSGAVTYVIDTGIPARKLPPQQADVVMEEIDYIINEEEDDEELL